MLPKKFTLPKQRLHPFLLGMLVVYILAKSYDWGYQFARAKFASPTTTSSK
jgi:hypothetical protein